jgi:hypothetical protein
MLQRSLKMTRLGESRRKGTSPKAKRTVAWAWFYYPNFYSVLMFSFSLAILLMDMRTRDYMVITLFIIMHGEKATFLCSGASSP